MDGAFQKTIPYYVKAKTHRGLVETMLENNQKNNRHFTYFQIVYDKKEFTAWYYVSQGELIKALFRDNQEKPASKK